ncbi:MULTISPECIES: hypothetical protein [Micrococcus]|uniref:Uncharacterized protein n=1 Tax=Micrococcus yunnanensis TaxID=566027 RepID=A0AAP5TA11_9MICC|nr:MULTISPECIES: hypothetical protein [Micrococcus]MBU8763422.1 hypothetical protein [Micrococcus luteus]MCM3479977.1 hypothetical protein [Micrococcus luteus]MCR4487965.1 hypothetical protein [Micrococcus luteus]MCT1857079.1 hypothetical protein [Micrococcus luteus]MCV7452015.1 hypothetical protein [Micrococcus luteus]
MKTRALLASALLLASTLVGAPAAAASAASAEDDVVTPLGLSKGTAEWTCRHFGIWCD